MNNELVKCDFCSTIIGHNQAYVSFVKNIEQIEHNIIQNEDEIEVIDSVELIKLCGGCGNKFDSTIFHLLSNSTIYQKGQN